MIQPLPDRTGFTARLAAPFDVSATGATSEEAYQELAHMVQQRLQSGMELRALPLPAKADSGWLPPDELTQEWLEHVKQYRAERDATDRSRLGTAEE